MPFMTDPAGWRLNYGGVEFGPYTTTTSFRYKPEKDRTGRTTKFNRYTISFKSIVAQTSVHASFPSVRAALSKNGRPFIFTGRAWGDFYVNTGRARDVENGPWVTDVQCRNLGGADRLIEVSWTIDFCIPECRDARYQSVPMEFAFSLTFNIDEFGYTTRTMNGWLKIPQNRDTPYSNVPQDSADDYLLDALPAKLPNFRRTYPSRELNEDRSELKFTVVDQELDRAAPPPGIVRESGSMDLSSDNAAAAVWSATLNYSCECGKDGQIADAIKAAEMFVAWKKQWFLAAARKTKSSNQVVPMSFRFAEPDALGRKKLEYSVTMMVTAGLGELLTNSGMWKQADGRGDWEAWTTSLLAGPMSHRGWAKLDFTTGDDTIVDLCSFGPLDNANRGASDVPDMRDVITNNFEPVPPEKSWIYYENHLHLEGDDGAVLIRLMPKKPLTDKTDLDADGIDAGKELVLGATVAGTLNRVIGGGVGNLFGGFPGGSGLGSALATNFGENKGERIRRPMQVVVMKGEALRVGFAIPQPSLKTVNGVKMIPANDAKKGDGFKSGFFRHNGVQPIFYARWQLRYVPDSDLPDLPMPLLPNPILNPQIA